ncbi:MAG: pilus assembly protein PilM [Rubrivivax sp.]
MERAEGQRPALRWVAEADWSQGSAALRRLRTARQLDRRQVVALLQRGQYQVVPLEAPDVPRDEWKQAIRWQCKDLVPFAIDEAAIDLLELPQSPSASTRAKVLAVAAPQAMVDALVEPVQGARIPLKAVDIPEVALRNVSALVEPAERAQALLYVGSHSLLVITAGGELLQTRAFELSAAQLGAADDDPVRRQAFDRVGLELQRTMDSFERQHTHLALARLLVAPAAGSAALCSFLRELLYTPVEELDVGDALNLSAVPALADPLAFGPWLPAVGAALREG